MRRIAVLAVLSLLAVALAVPAAQRVTGKGRRTYLVLYKKGVSLEAAHRAIRRAGGRIVRENKRIGLALVATRSKRFKTRAGRSSSVAGVARNRRIGRARPKRSIEKVRGAHGRGKAELPAVGGDPFSPCSGTCN